MYLIYSIFDWYLDIDLYSFFALDIAGYGPWTSWTYCNKTCGDGFHNRTRTCIGDPSLCSNESSQTKGCILSNCPGMEIHTPSKYVPFSPLLPPSSHLPPTLPTLQNVYYSIWIVFLYDMCLCSVINVYMVLVLIILLYCSLYRYRYIVIIISPWKLVRLDKLEFLYSDMWIG